MGDKPKRNVKGLRMRNEELVKSAKPHLEQGEEVGAIFMGQSRFSPIWILLMILIPPILIVYFILFLFGLIVPPIASLLPHKRVVLVTDRNAYCFSKQGGRFGVKDVLHKLALGEVAAECGFTWSLKVDGWPRLYASELGIRGERAQVVATINQASSAASS